MEIEIKIIGFLILAVVLLFLSAWFSGMETALTNLSVVQVAQMRKRKERNSRYIFYLKRYMNRTLVAILIGNNVVNISLSALAALMAEDLFQTVGVSVAVGILTFLIIIFGEITPKSLAIDHSQRVAQANARIMYWLVKVISPLITFFMAISSAIIRVFGVKVKYNNLLVTDQVIRDIAALGFEQGALQKSEEQIIKRVMVYGEKKVTDVMVPMERVFVLEKGMTIEASRKMIARSGFTRVPLINKKNKVLGLIYAKDLLLAGRGKLESIKREAMFVSMSGRLPHLLSQMKKRRIHLAIVQDRKGNNLGILTMEDILEELVGEIFDEYSKMKYRGKKI